MPVSSNCPPLNPHDAPNNQALNREAGLGGHEIFRMIPRPAEAKKNDTLGFVTIPLCDILSEIYSVYEKEAKTPNCGGHDPDIL